MGLVTGTCLAASVNYRSPNLRALKDALRSPLVLDGRHLYEPHAMAAAGLTYLGIGRNNLGLLAPGEQAVSALSAPASLPSAA